MKRLLISSVLTAFVILMFISASNLFAQVPSPARWLQQIGSEYDSTKLVYVIELEWQDGLIDADHPQADEFKVYRSMIGYMQELDDYDFVGTATGDDIVDGKYKFKDNIQFEGGYFYYVCGIYNDIPGEFSPTTQAFSRSSYCVNMDGEIVDFKSFPPTMAIPGELYSYQAYAKHRSLRVQGFVRYHLVEGPENMTVDNLKGIVQWTPPEDAQGNYYVKIRATSDEDSRAESIQEWYIRIANNDEVSSLPTSVFDNNENNSLIIFPNPAGNNININYNAISNNIQIEFISLDGQLLNKRCFTVVQSENIKNISVNELSAGTYFLKIIDNERISSGKVIIKK